ncbi:MAG: alpha/beta hydrolase fold protein [uncultured bacterium]|nr:MAG: alpha/beta hydrolase fold protein [uncultured bacterium]
MYKIISSIRVFTAIFAIFVLFSPAHARTFQIADNRFISYTDIGHGRPIILIHAFPTDRRLWEPARNEIEDVFRDSRIFRIISIDLWGFGQSSSANGQAIMMSDYADEVSQLLDHLDIKSAVIGGESMGGYIALAFLEKFPKKVEGLILSDTQSIADSPETKAKREATAVDVIEHGTENLINEFISKALSPDASEKTRMFLKYVLEKQDKMAIASALRGMALRHDTSNILANSSLPILILTGEKDKVISPQQSQNMHALAKNSKLIVIPNAGHLSSLEQPKKWINAVIDMFYVP